MKKEIEYKSFGNIKVGNDGSVITKRKGINFGYNQHGYCRVSVGNKMMSIHRIVAHLFLDLDIEKQENQVDHIDGNKSNNRIENLRIVTNRENSSNRESHRNGRLVGCSFIKKTNKWKSQIRVNKKRIFLGYFDTELEAHEAYIKTLKEMI
jgi:hypothetical protein